MQIYNFCGKKYVALVDLQKRLLKTYSRSFYSYANVFNLKRWTSDDLGAPIFKGKKRNRKYTTLEDAHLFIHHYLRRFVEYQSYDTFVYNSLNECFVNMMAIFDNCMATKSQIHLWNQAHGITKYDHEGNTITKSNTHNRRIPRSIRINDALFLVTEYRDYFFDSMFVETINDACDTPSPPKKRHREEKEEEEESIEVIHIEVSESDEEEEEENMTNISVVKQMSKVTPGCPQNCRNWGVEKPDGTCLIEPGTCGKPFDDRKCYIFDYTYGGYDCTTTLCECQLAKIGVVPSIWTMHEVDASHLFKNAKINRVVTQARPIGINEFEVNFFGKCVRVPQMAVHQPRGYDIDQTYNSGDRVEVLVAFEKFQAWVDAFVVKACENKLLYMVMFVEYYGDEYKGLQKVAYHRMRKTTLSK